MKLFRRAASAAAAAIMMLTSLSFGASAQSSTEKLSERMLEGSLTFEDYIDVSDIVKENGWDINKLADMMASAYLYEPELFFLNNELNAYYNGSRYYIQPKYTMSKSEYQAAKKKFDEAAEKAVSGITDDMTDVEKALYVHDYIILNCAYDNNKKNYDAYDCLVDRTSVCQGYSLAYCYILRNYLDIDCSIVYSDSMMHAWNYVKIGKNWYHVDLTKDDANSVYKNNSYDNYGFVMHENFLLSDTGIRNTIEPHYDWKIINDLPAATETSYDKAFWKGCNSPLVFDGSTGYYITSEKADSKINVIINSYNFKTGRSKKILKVGAKWFVRRNSSGTETYPYGQYFYSAAWMSLAKRGNKIYFNTNKYVYSYDISTKKVKKIYTLDKGDDQIFGMMFVTSDRLRLAYRTDMTYPEKYITLKFN